MREGRIGVSGLFRGRYGGISRDHHWVFALNVFREVTAGTAIRMVGWPAASELSV
jgi:hypothetical protein